MTPQERYAAAAHAMQSGVAMDMESDPSGSKGATTPKHLRVGVNSAMVTDEGLATLLIAKGVITLDEYTEAVTVAMEAEQARYEQLLTERFGGLAKFTLA
jgi:hypothetical protein